MKLLSHLGGIDEARVVALAVDLIHALGGILEIIYSEISPIISFSGN